jgi:methyl-accepting chemotaxis protein
MVKARSRRKTPRGHAVQKVFHSINSRILLIPIIALLALIVAGLVSIRTIANVTLQEHQARARAVADASTKIVEYYEGKAARGE